MNSATRPCLPLFKSMAEAVALSKKEQDTFYIDTLFIQRWLARANKEAVAEYVEKKDPRDRCLQTGSAWRLFRESFGDLTDPEFALLFKSMARLTTYDDPISRCLAQARYSLQIEHDCTGDYFGPKTPSPVPLAHPMGEGLGVRAIPHSSFCTPPSAFEVLLRRTVERWCDWLDAANHLHMHQLWHHVPIYFDPDVEKRDLASLGLVQRNYSDLNDWMKGVWQHDHAKLAQQFNHSPKWLIVGQAMASQDQRLWTYHELDTRIIYLWPLLKKYNWTYRDLMNVINSLHSSRRSSQTKAPNNPQQSTIHHQPTYPCQREQDFVVHCRTVLGLRKNGRGKSAKDGAPRGHGVAKALFDSGTQKLPKLS